MKRLISLLLCVAFVFAFGACDIRPDTKNDMPETVTGSLTFKDYGTVKFEIYPTKAPQSALNFIYLAKSGFYNGIVVHRLANNFVIQAGAYEAGYTVRKPEFDYNIVGEFSENGIDNPVKHVKGAISWARATDFNSASTQIFICTDDTTAPQLDGKYAAFGMVTDGFDILETIDNLPVGANDVPNEEITIESVVIDSDYNFPEPDFIKH